MKLGFVLVAAATSLLFPVAASALEYTVRYDVDAKALKDCVAGTPVTYNLYADAACTVLAGTQVVNVEDIDTIEVLKTFTPKGGTKPPKTARTWQAVSLPAPRWFSHAKLSGTGITPVGGDCQPQFNSAPTGLASSVPGGVVPIAGGSTSLAQLVIEAPADGKVDLLFETVLRAVDVNQYIECTISDNMAYAGYFLMDPGDEDAPIVWFDLSQTHHEVLSVTQGTHTFEVSCGVNSGSVDTFGSKLVASYFGAGL